MWRKAKAKYSMAPRSNGKARHNIATAQRGGAAQGKGKAQQGIATARHSGAQFGIARQRQRHGRGQPRLAMAKEVIH